MDRGIEGEAEARAVLFTHLVEHRAKIESAILTRVLAIQRIPAQEGAEYLDGLPGAISAGVSYALAGLRGGAELRPSVPAPLLVQARVAARSGVSLDLALRHYFAGYTLFGDFVVQAARGSERLHGSDLNWALQGLVPLFEPVALGVVNEHIHERRERHRSPQQRRLAQVRKLLAGEPIDPRELAYELGDWHVGAVARGRGAVSALRQMAQLEDRLLLSIQPDSGSVWAWFGGRRRAPIELTQRGFREWPAGVQVAIGEPARGIEGWRLTHQQACAALRTARPGTQGIVRYVDVSLLASISQDQVLSRSLRQLYLTPLADGRDGGAALRKTLRAYFSAGRNISSAASALGLSRQTVRSRLHAIEEKLGRSLDSCAPEIEVALRLENIGDTSVI